MINYSKKQDLHNKLSKSSNKRPFLATTTHQCTTVCHYMVRYPFLHYSALFLWVFPYFTYTRCTFFMLRSFVCACLCFHFLHVAFYLLCSLFMVPCFSAILPIVSVFTMSYYFHIAVSCFHVVFFFISYFFYFFIFLSSLISFHVAVFSYSTFLCSTFFMLHF